MSKPINNIKIVLHIGKRHLRGEGLTVKAAFQNMLKRHKGRMNEAEAATIRRLLK